jgi:hypothetical protein
VGNLNKNIFCTFVENFDDCCIHEIKKNAINVKNKLMQIKSTNNKKNENYTLHNIKGVVALLGFSGTLHIWPCA